MDLALTLRSEKGLSYTTENHHDFAVIIAGPEACSRTHKHSVKLHRI